MLFLAITLIHVALLNHSIHKQNSPCNKTEFFCQNFINNLSNLKIGTTLQTQYYMHYCKFKSQSFTLEYYNSYLHLLDCRESHDAFWQKKIASRVPTTPYIWTVISHPIFKLHEFSFNLFYFLNLQIMHILNKKSK